MARKLWPPDVWKQALRATGSQLWALHTKKAQCESVAAHHGWRVWAYDLGCKPGGTSHPKGYVAAPVDIFGAAYYQTYFEGSLLTRT